MRLRKTTQTLLRWLAEAPGRRIRRFLPPGGGVARIVRVRRSGTHRPGGVDHQALDLSEAGLLAEEAVGWWRLSARGIAAAEELPREIPPHELRCSHRRGYVRCMELAEPGEETCAKHSGDAPAPDGGRLCRQKLRPNGGKYQRMRRRRPKKAERPKAPPARPRAQKAKPLEPAAPKPKLPRIEIPPSAPPPPAPPPKATRVVVEEAKPEPKRCDRHGIKGCLTCAEVEAVSHAIYQKLRSKIR